MCGFSAVAVIRLDSAWRCVISRFTWMPAMHFSANSVTALDSSLIWSSTLRAINGTRTFSSKLPCVPATVTAASLPITCAQTIDTTSGMTGFTLPGMIELPFCSSGRNSSARPARGPEPIHAMSFAILVSETASTFSIADSSTRASRLPCASKACSGGRISRPVSPARRSRTRAANSGGC